MSYQSKLRAGLRDIRALISDPIGKARAMGQKGTDAELSAIAKQMIKAFAEHAEQVAELALNQAFVEGKQEGESACAHLVPPSGTLEDQMISVWREGCQPSITLVPQGDWVVGIRAGDQTLFSGRGQDATAALVQAQEKINSFRETAGNRPMRQA